MFTHLRHLAAILAASALLVSCSKKDSIPTPTASFTYAATYNSNTHAPATVSFTNNSSNAGEFSWNFGDGGTATANSPMHRYGMAGTFTVTLISSSGSKTSTSTQSITILPAYTKAKITQIILTSVTESSTFNGYFKIKDPAGTVLWQSAATYINPAALPIAFNLSAPVTLPTITVIYTAELWKVGTFSDTKIATTPLAPGLYATGDLAANSYPAKIAGTGGLSFGVQWE